MPGIACQTVDSAGGAQIGDGQSKFKIRGLRAVVLGGHVEPHPVGFPHEPVPPTMVEATEKFRITGIPTCREGHSASCGHSTTGRSFFRIP